MPMALPPVLADRLRMTTRLAFSLAEKSLSIRSYARPVTFGSMPEPLISLPIRSTTSTSRSVNGSRGILALAKAFSRVSSARIRSAGTPATASTLS